VHIDKGAGNKKSPKYADQISSQSFRHELSNPQTGLKLSWTLITSPGANYLRQEFTFQAGNKPVDVKELILLRVKSPKLEVVGKCLGSPLVGEGFFAGIELPMSRSRITEDGIGEAAVQRVLPILAGQKVTYSTVIGVAPEGQMRRAVLRYVERERAHPYRPFLHYNSWYDLAFGEKFFEDGCIDRINAFGTELVKKRGVVLSSYLFDDGWDETKSDWRFHSGFPNGFAKLKEAAAKYNAAPGVWFSPWGGYSRAREERLTYGKSVGLEIDDEGYALSGPKYYKRFREACLEMVTKYGINQFKFDGTGDPDKVYPGSAFGSDFEACIDLIGDLRQAKPDLFMNVTTGTWPSPFWGRFADSIWRGGSDHSFSGVGPKRQQWITYRDADTYRGVVQRGPLYPINSLMLHGIIYAEHANGLKDDPTNAFRDEIWSYFGTGTQLQELYITPSLLSKQNWDDLAEAAKWSRKNAESLVDVHWVGGNPKNLEVYGWASWSGKSGTLTLRNPSDMPRTFDIDIAKFYELPNGSVGTLVGKNPFKAGRTGFALELPIGNKVNLDLKPFEVVVLEVRPK